MEDSVERNYVDVEWDRPRLPRSRIVWWTLNNTAYVRIEFDSGIDVNDLVWGDDVVGLQTTFRETGTILAEFPVDQLEPSKQIHLAEVIID